MSHALLAPSSASVWGKPGGCRGSVAMRAAFPQPPNSQDTLEGEAAHWVGETMIRAGLRTGDFPVDPLSVGTLAENGTLITQEIYESAEVYARHVLKTCRESLIFGGEWLRIEEQLGPGAIHAENYGTPDAVLYDKKREHLHVWDFKHGHLYVDEYENWQLINYYALLCKLYDIDGRIDPAITVHFHIVQPRVYRREAVRTWTVRGSELRGHVNQLRNAAAEAICGEELRSGPHCKYCSARYACPTANDAGAALLEACQALDIVDVSNATLSTQLEIVERAYEQIKALKTGLVEQAEVRALLGERLPGFHMAPGRSSTGWTQEPENVIALGDAAGIDLRNKKPITPKQAITAGMPEIVINALSETRPGALKLCRDGSKFKKVFK